MTTISSVVLSIFSSPSKPKTVKRRQEFRDIMNIPTGVAARPTDRVEPKRKRENREASEVSKEFFEPPRRQSGIALRILNTRDMLSKARFEMANA
jgi:hypothetical protein